MIRLSVQFESLGEPSLAPDRSSSSAASPPRPSRPSRLKVASQPCGLGPWPVPCRHRNRPYGCSGGGAAAGGADTSLASVQQLMQGARRRPLRSPCAKDARSGLAAPSRPPLCCSGPAEASAASAARLWCDVTATPAGVLARARSAGRGGAPHCGTARHSLSPSEANLPVPPHGEVGPRSRG